MAINQPKQEKTMQSILEEILVVDGKIHRDAVDAGLLFLDIYSRWELIRGKMQVIDRTLFDIIVHGVLTGSAQREPDFIRTLSNFTSEMMKTMEGDDHKQFAEFMLDISIGTIFTNPFIVQNNLYLFSAVMTDGLSIVKGKKTYNILSAIGQLVGGTNTSMKLSLGVSD